LNTTGRSVNYKQSHEISVPDRPNMSKLVTGLCPKVSIIITMIAITMFMVLSS